MHRVMTRGRMCRLDDVAGRMHAWNPRKRQFANRQINILSDRLQEQGRI